MLGSKVLDVLAQLHILSLVFLEALIGRIQLLLNGLVLLALLLVPVQIRDQIAECRLCFDDNSINSCVYRRYAVEAIRGRP